MNRAMRRVNKLVEDRKWQEDVLQRGQTIYLALASPEGEPYVVPMGYGYEAGVIYLHGATAGLKNDLAAANPRVCFNVSLDIEVVRGDVGSDFTMKYRSVTGFGRISTIQALDEKNHALAVLMRQYDGPHADLTAQNEASVWVARIDIEEMKGKSSGYPKPE